MGPLSSYYGYTTQVKCEIDYQQIMQTLRAAQLTTNQKTSKPNDIQPNKKLLLLEDV